MLLFSSVVVAARCCTKLRASTQLPCLNRVSAIQDEKVKGKGFKELVFLELEYFKL